MIFKYFYKKEEKKIKEALTLFLNKKRNKNNDIHLLIDGTGVNLSYQVLFFYCLGLDFTLNKTKKIHAVSGGGQALLNIWAISNHLSLFEKDHCIKTYNNAISKNKIHILITLFKILFKQNKITLSEVFKFFLKEEFFIKTISELPDNFNFYCYSSNKKEIVTINNKSEYKDMNLQWLVDSISCLPVFNSVKYKNDVLLDPIINRKLYVKMIKKIQKESLEDGDNNILINSNMIYDNVSDSILNIKIHNFKYYKLLFFIDFILWINGFTFLKTKRIHYAMNFVEKIEIEN